MSRTVHHTPYRHRRGLQAPERSSLLATGHQLYSLRYPAAELRRAARDGRRPVPAKRRETFVAYTYPRATGDHDVARFARRAHRRSRHRARRELTVIRQVVNAAPAAAILDDLDVSPPPRRSAIWDAG